MVAQVVSCQNLCLCLFIGQENVLKLFQWFKDTAEICCPSPFPTRGEICPSRHCRQQCKIFASGVNFSIFIHFFVFLSLLKLGEINSVKMLALKSNSVKFWSNLISVSYIYLPTTLLFQDGKLTHDKRLVLGFTKKMGELDILPSRYGVLLTFLHAILCRIQFCHCA